MLLGGAWHTLTPKSPPPPNSPDVRLLQEQILSPIFGITDPRSDKNLGFIPGNQGIEMLEQKYRTGEIACAFSLFPCNVEELMQVSDLGIEMEPKSTYFEPKHRSGMLVYRFK